jgi:hypothetical protein
LRFPAEEVAFEADTQDRPDHPESRDFVERMDRMLAAIPPRDLCRHFSSAFADCMDRLVLYAGEGTHFRYLAVSPQIEAIVGRPMAGRHFADIFSPWPLLDGATSASAARVIRRRTPLHVAGSICYRSSLGYRFEAAAVPVIGHNGKRYGLARVSLTPLT